MDEPEARKDRQPPKAPTTPDAVEIAMEAEASGRAPTGEASALLRRHSALIDKQIVLANNQIFRNRILVGVVVALIVAVGAAVWSASRTTGLVIQPFSVPPELAEDGLDGRAVAALFQDELVRLDTATDSARPASSFRNDWSEGITVEVDAGGLSISDAYTALVRWLGQETLISGGLSRTRDGLELVVRSSDGTAVTVQGPADQPEALMRQAAERVYEQTQPYRYAIYVGQPGDALPDGPERQAHYDRKRAILTTLLDSPSQTERVWAYNGLAAARDTTAQDTIPILEAALEIDPEHPNILANLNDSSRILGHAEASMGYAQRVLASLSAPRNRAKVSEDRQEQYAVEYAALVAVAQGDWLQALELYTGLSNSDQPTVLNYRHDRVNALIALHQPSVLQRLIEAEALRARGRPGPGDTGFRLQASPLYGDPIFGLRANAAASLDQWPQAVAALEAWEVEVAPTLPPRTRSVGQTLVWPRLAYARARTGDLTGAQALIAATPLDCYLCVRQRARIAELAGDRPAADRWSAEARRQGPSLPFAFAERGQMLMARGDPAGAIAFYEQAIERGPRWADPHKYWGDALMAQGDEAGAIRRYRAAADRAPQWGALHLAWGRALEAQGRRDRAREKYAEAARMDLSATDRAEVVRRLAAADD